MIVLAVLLLVAVIALVVFVLLAGVDQQVNLSSSLLNLDWNPSVLVVFLLGALSLLLAEVALALLRAGGRRKVERRRELKRLRAAEQERAARTVPMTEPGETSDHDRTEGSHGSHEALDGRDERDDRGSGTRAMPVAPGDHDGSSSPHTSASHTTASEPGWHDQPSDDGRRSSAH